ncbi:alpha/beta fold hydrolase [Streptomyces brasiliscabiei]|uniref:Alpha/beta fold hydrolase n=1 Tax=Streptomyces brasiliscabiei TaxID=2736302 RepID=A0ABU8G8M1_9ACTN
MTGPARAAPHEVRRITLDAAGLPLSALLCEPSGGSARAVVAAVHGGGMNAGYFDCRAHPRQSLLTLGASLGYTVLALDRPGYRHSAARLPEGQELAEQAVSLRAALHDFASRHDTGGGLFLLAHSYGGKVALTAAADPAPPHLLGLDISGCGHLYAVEPHELPTDPDDRGRLRRSWGPLRLYPSGTFLESGTIVEPVPALERAELARWPRLFRTTAPRVRVPVRLTFAEHEAWWRHDEEALTDLAAHFTAAPRVSVDRQPAAGHNISLGWAARSYHLRALAFLEDCLTARETTLPPRAARPEPSATLS